MAVDESSLFLLDLPAPEYQTAAVFCSLGQENIVTAAFLPAFTFWPQIFPPRKCIQIG